MIAEAEMMGVLLNACPSFAPLWQTFADDWRGESDRPPLYVALADFARHLIHMLERGDTIGLSAAFRAIERLHVDGDEWVRKAATIGILESLQNQNLHRSTEPDQFCSYLKPQSARWWDKLNRFWEQNEPLVDE